MRALDENNRLAIGMAAGSDQSRLVDYWLTKRRPDRLPGRDDIDPVEMPRELLPNIALIAVERRGLDEMRCRFRLVGTNIVRNFGRDVTGCLFEEVFLSPDKLKAERAQIARVVQTRESAVVRDRLNIPGRQFITVTRTLLPLAANGHDVDMILSYSDFD